jgi:hypothetical protein
VPIRKNKSPPGEAAALPKHRAELYFDPPGIGAFLAPELAVDGAPTTGFSLRSIYLPAVNKRGSQDFRSYVLEFVDPDTAESVRMTLAAGAQGECFGRAGEHRLPTACPTTVHVAAAPAAAAERQATRNHHTHCSARPRCPDTPHHR